MDWKSILSGVVGTLLTAAVLWGIGVIGKVPTIIIPSKAVVAFNSEECPTGWEPYKNAIGRTIIGVGEGNHDQNKQSLTPRFLNQTAGEEQHILKETEIPLHAHGEPGLENWRIAWGHNGNKQLAPNMSSNWGLGVVMPFADRNPDFTGPRFMTSSGGNQPHNNMPPFVSLLYCIKK